VVELEDWVSQRTSFAQSSSVAVKAAWSSSEVDEVEQEAEWDEEDEEDEEEDLSSLGEGSRGRGERGMSTSIEVGGEEKGV